MTQTSLLAEQARQIVNIFDEAGNYEHPLPVTDAEYIVAAAEIVGAAQRARNVGKNGVVVNTILNIADGHTFIAPAPEDPPWDENDLTNVVPPDTTKDVAPTATATDVPTTEPIAAEEDTAAASTDATPLESDQEKESSSPLPALPRDFSLLGDQELRSWHARLHADYAQVVHELGIEEADYESAQVNLAQVTKIEMSKVTSDKVTDRREKAAVTPEVMDWTDKMNTHHRKVILYRAYEKIIDRQITGLSREFSMRSAERTNTPS